MKIKTTLLALFISLFTIGCEVTSVEHINYRDGLSRYEATIVAKRVFHTEPTRHTTYSDRYGYYYEGEIDNTELGYLTYTTVDDFYRQQSYYNPYVGSLEIYPGDRFDEYDYIYCEVVNTTYIYITIYDQYGNSYDRFKVTWRDLGY
jgi:hypothetical protein